MRLCKGTWRRGPKPSNSLAHFARGRCPRGGSESVLDVASPHREVLEDPAADCWSPVGKRMSTSEVRSGVVCRIGPRGTPRGFNKEFGSLGREKIFGTLPSFGRLAELMWQHQQHGGRSPASRKPGHVPFQLQLGVCVRSALKAGCARPSLAHRAEPAPAGDGKCASVCFAQDFSVPSEALA